ncbi:MAG: Uma2 family endonuclease, partial [Runella sp.]
QRVLTATDDGLYSYPDIIVICGSPRFTDMVKDTVTNPSVIVEILSKSTEAYDRGEKFRLYRRLPTFIEYVLIDATKIRAEVYRKNEEGIWSLMADADKLEHDIYLNTIDLRLSLNDIYEGWSELPEDE